jgi:hypothetical protein
MSVPASANEVIPAPDQEVPPAPAPSTDELLAKKVRLLADRIATLESWHDVEVAKGKNRRRVGKSMEKKTWVGSWCHEMPKNIVSAPGLEHEDYATGTSIRTDILVCSCITQSPVCLSVCVLQV